MNIHPILKLVYLSIVHIGLCFRGCKLGSIDYSGSVFLKELLWVLASQSLAHFLPSEQGRCLFC
ncbi:hypothetical protein M758_9G015700 [Ceratodon purpureus]|uniref:Uncharacterized protein n=1 Tax=Ceratodon purpureus TaxID=3225 RepID=A0A8T0GQU8_CERPU|nr:hypothetical protein KC19_9G015900 [Ceratodon purpureus]KAG0604877.1 hypothetical protein M758_9G015700 [Ceratodon purpureus]